MTRIVRFVPAASASQRGLSLIELMVALVLSLLLMLGLVEIFGSTRAAFGASSGLARTQENSRFALDFLRRDTRMAGHLGCLNEFGHIAIPEQRFYNHLIVAGAAFTTATSPLRIDAPIQVYEFTGSTPGTTYTIAAPAVATDGSGWTPALPTGATQLNVIKAGTGGIVPGSDVLVVRYFDEAPLTLSAGATSTTTWPLGQGGVNGATGTVYTGPNTANVVANALYGVTNCKSASLFQVTSINLAAGTVSSNAGQNQANPTGSTVFWDAKEVFGIGSMMFRYRAVAYYVGLGANGGPSLFRLALRESPITAPADGVRFSPTPEEVVEGVELMQILLATAAVPTATGRVDDVTGYQSVTTLLTGAADEAARVTALRRVASIRVSLLLRSPDPGAGVNPVSPTKVVGDVTVTPPLDQRIRHVYDSMILLRNRQRA